MILIHRFLSLASNNANFPNVALFHRIFPKRKKIEKKKRINGGINGEMNHAGGEESARTLHARTHASFQLHGPLIAACPSFARNFHHGGGKQRGLGVVTNAGNNAARMDNLSRFRVQQRDASAFSRVRHPRSGKAEKWNFPTGETSCCPFLCFVLCDVRFLRDTFGRRYCVKYWFLFYFVGVILSNVRGVFERYRVNDTICWMMIISISLDKIGRYFLRSFSFISQQNPV